jgi:hypothetical protein
VTDYRAMARAAAARMGLDQDLFEKQIGVESIGYRPDVIECRTDSPAGARGIAQLMPVHWSAVDPCNPEAALAYAAGLMSNHADYWRRRGYDDRAAFALALCSYNAGRQATIDGLAGTKANWPFRETVSYLVKILGISDAEARRIMTGSPVATDPAPILARVIEIGQTQIGKRYAGPIIGEPDSYRWGDPGFDCSSFVSWCYQQATDGRLKLPGYTDAIADLCDAVADPRPGDIVFYRYPDPSQVAYWPHMGIWLSPTEVLDCRFGVGFGVGRRGHVTQVYEHANRFRKTMRPRALATISPPPPVTPPPSPPSDELAKLRAEVARLQAEGASLRKDLADRNRALGYLTVEVAEALQAAVNTLRAHKPA